ncbi:PQQ-dependent sugar dehydrogenase [Cellulomonas shaoxiangyii]|uniref:Glucose dehydrogenase n=1 Tax=Cellulomonas shaoxiangyii TaxID=2566013 RepID=A0A4P7SIV6_9CELL|nr:PQQ-dependent sugar dehydrogenase [Cellulomonas shaoxiangyii]QCB94032.1 glucose dehydrogenase [Cellulomonas shaoxiangyii]TGY85779.1 glucose dehydrogenase [Cellulomonas shaoxiangyii]
MTPATPPARLLAHSHRPRPRHARLLAGLVAAALAVLLVPAAAGPAAAATVEPGRWYVLVNRASGKALDVAGSATTEGAAIVQRTRDDRTSQQWRFVAAGDGWYRLQARHSGRALDITGASRADGARAVQWTDRSAAHQQVRLADSAGGYVRLVVRHSGKALDVLNASLADGAPVVQWTDRGQTNQQWQLVPLGASTDTSAPTPPGGLRTTGLTCTAVTLSWTASTDNVGVAAYDIYHDGQQMTSVPGTATSAVLTLSPGVTWGMYVNARDAAGNVSQASPTLELTVPPCQTDTAAPTTPTGVTASADGTSATVRWTASTDDVGVTGYEVLRGGVVVGTVPGSATSFVDAGLAAGTAYSYAVRARDQAGNRSPASAAVTVTTGATCTGAGVICSVRQVATDRDLPWGLVELPDGSVLYGRRDAGRVVRLDPATGTTTVVAGTFPGMAGTDGEGGLMGLAVAPDFATDPWLYVMHTTATDNRVVRVRYVDGALSGTPQVLVQGIPRNKYHNGGRLRFGPDGMLYVATGDGQNPQWAQDTANLAGKVLRIHPDGRVPADNPFGNAVWSYGHRNPQGLAFDSRGRLWQQEFGNSLMDETNLVVRGGNYGWPQCEGTSGSCSDAGLVAPKLTMSTAAASCSGIAVVGDSLWIACLRGTRLYRATITADGSLTGVQSLLQGTYGRLRTVEPSADGGLWVTTSTRGDKDSVANNSDERILKITLGR